MREKPIDVPVSSSWWCIDLTEKHIPKDKQLKSFIAKIYALHARKIPIIGTYGFPTPVKEISIRSDNVKDSTAKAILKVYPIAFGIPIIVPVKIEEGKKITIKIPCDPIGRVECTIVENGLKHVVVCWNLIAFPYLCSRSILGKLGDDP